jgi:Arc/MetJ-type ribon-helix-helix transcriptional regulator
MTETTISPADALRDAVGRMEQARKDRDAAMRAMREDGESLASIASVAGMTPRGVQHTLGGKGH